MDAVCSEPGCGQRVYARTLCSPHYQKARSRGNLPASIATKRSCAHCGSTMVGRSSARAKFCTPQCKDAAATEANSQRLLAARKDRTCAECQARFTPQTGKGKFCTRSCGVKYQNRKRAEAKKAERRAQRLPCKACDGAIPPDAHGGAIYCSSACKRRVHAARYRERYPDYMRQYLYGLSAQDYAELLESQGGVCAVCGSDEWPGKGNTPHVDHCHATRNIRGILCGNCNNGLGMFLDDPVRLRAAADYLERSRTTP